MADKDPPELQFVQWQSAVDSSLGTFERDDKRRIEELNSFEALNEALTRFQMENKSTASSQGLSIMTPSLRHFNVFSSFFMSSNNGSVDSSCLWGMTYLAIELSEKANGLLDFAKMLKNFGHKLELFNAFCEQAAITEQVKEATLDVNLELLTFFTFAINYLRRYDIFDLSQEQQMLPLTHRFTGTSHAIEEDFSRIEKLTQLVKYTSHVEEVARLQNLLSLSSGSMKDDTRQTVIHLPPSKDAEFYDRDNVIERIHKHLTDQPKEMQLRSLALHGLGGVGKSHVALKFAHAQSQELDAVLWVHSETAAALEQSFTDIAIRLKLPGATPQRHEENRILVLTWLQQTTSRWLLVYDNAEDSDTILKYWPVASPGWALITTRSRALGFQPAQKGLEIQPFDVETGSNFLLSLLAKDIAADITSVESKSAMDLSKKLDGHALAIAQMAGLIHRRRWSLKDFLAIYDRNTQRLHGAAEGTSLDVVWQLSFKSLDSVSSAFLAVLSYIMPDSIPQILFEPANKSAMPASLIECCDELNFSEVLESLLDLALIKRDDETRTLSLHRLVQTQFKFFLPAEDRQRGFEDAAHLLYEAFPSSNAYEGQLYARWTRCQLYIQHALALRDNYAKQSKGPERLRPTLDFCLLLKSCARYMLEIASYVELESVMTLLRSAFDDLPEAQKDQGLLADICASTGLMWAHRGLFVLSEPNLRESYDIRMSIEPLDRLEVSWTDVNLGNVTASTGRNEEALNWQLSAQTARRKWGDETHNPLSPNGLLGQNIGRCYRLLGRFQEAHVALTESIGILLQSQNWAMLAYTQFALACLHHKEKNLEQAQSTFREAQDTWLTKGQLRTHHFNGACMFKLGCVAYELGAREEAIERLRESLVVAQLHQAVMCGDYARILHKLAEVLGEGNPMQIDALELEEEAVRVLSRRQEQYPSAPNVGEDNDYDELIYILWR